MMRTMSAVLLTINVVLGVALGPGQPMAQPATGALHAPTRVQAILQRLSDALPGSGRLLRAKVVSSPRYGVRVLGEEVVVTSAFLRDASSDALAAGVACQLLPDPVHFAITIDRAGFDGPGGLAELNERLLYDIALERQYLAAVDAAYAEATEADFQNSFWIFGMPGHELMSGRLMDAASIRYYEALSAYETYRAERPDLPPITAGFILAWIAGEKMLVTTDCMVLEACAPMSVVLDLRHIALSDYRGLRQGSQVLVEAVVSHENSHHRVIATSIVRIEEWEAP